MTSSLFVGEELRQCPLDIGDESVKAIVRQFVLVGPFVEFALFDEPHFGETIEIWVQPPMQ
jgi:hypothetical protein